MGPRLPPVDQLKETDPNPGRHPWYADQGSSQPGHCICLQGAWNDHNRIAKISIEEFAKSAWPFIIAMLISLVLITCIPQITLFLPTILRR